MTDSDSRQWLKLDWEHDELHTYPGPQADLDSSAGDNLLIYNGGYESDDDIVLEVYSREALGVLRWLDMVRDAVALSACREYAYLKSNGYEDELAKLERGAVNGMYRFVKDNDVRSKYRIEKLSWDEWFELDKKYNPEKYEGLDDLDDHPF